jgi:hypothetical protein
MDKATERPSVQAPVVWGIHCGDCPYLEPYGRETDLTAKCKLLGRDLMFHDYWIAECDTHNAQ